MELSEKDRDKLLFLILKTLSRYDPELTGPVDYYHKRIFCFTEDDIQTSVNNDIPIKTNRTPILPPPPEAPKTIPLNDEDFLSAPNIAENKLKSLSPPPKPPKYSIHPKI